MSSQNLPRYRACPGCFFYFFSLWLAGVLTSLSATNTLETITYQSSVSSDNNGALDLKMELNYNNASSGMPIAVVMHQFSATTGNFSAYRANAQRLRDNGFFVLTVAMRGREGSDGSRDTGGLEIYDIYDAVEYVKTNYGGLVDTTNISITGYSGGGGNVMSAVTKFPDYFRAASSFFGMSDYGYDETNGWYFDGANSGHTIIMNTDIGNPTLGDPSIADKYMARASNLASKNNPYTEIHLFANNNETLVPLTNHISYRDNAVAAATTVGEFDNITVHVGAAGTYYDFNENEINDPDEQQYWPHQAPTADQQAAAEQWYLDRLLSNEIAQPVLNSEDSLFIAGFVKTSLFEAWVGDGRNAAAQLDYVIHGSDYQFILNILSSDTDKTAWLEIDLADYNGFVFQAYLNGELTETFVADGVYRYDGFGNGETLVLQAVPEPAYCALLVGVITLFSFKLRRNTRV